MQPKVSVIIPVYNCEMFLRECIESLQGQTMHEIEMIFVCDASPDNSLSILREYEAKDPRISVIAFEKNRGVSAARNAGIERAKGEYVIFCDGDDWIEPGMYQRLYDMAKEYDADIAFCRVFKDYASKQENVPLGFATGTRFDRDSIRSTLIPAMLSKEIDSDDLPLSGYTPRNLFRREVIGAHRFREDIRYAEDLLFIVECMLDSHASVAVDEAYYHYRFHGQSVTKRYSAHVPKSHDLSNDAIEALLCDLPECVRRMTIRRRKMAVTAVRNLCYPGTPYGFIARVKQARAYMNREDVRAWFADIRPLAFPPKLAMRLLMMKYRMAFAMCFLFTYIFDRV